VELYPWVVFLHVVGTVLFFIAHGTNMAVGFRLKREHDPARIRALLDLSSWSLGVAPSIALVVGVLAGIAAGIMGDWFGQAWIWIALVLLVAISGYMTPMVAARLNVMRTAAGTQSMNPLSKKPAAAPAGHDPVELERLLDAWNPVPAATIGLGGFVIIVWLMFFKPF